jgi:hypothetical protein
MDHSLLADRAKKDGECWQFGQWLCENLHTAAVAVRYAKGLCLMFYSRGSKSRVVAKSAGSGEPVLMNALLYGP